MKASSSAFLQEEVNEAHPNKKRSNAQMGLMKRQKHSISIFTRKQINF